MDTDRQNELINKAADEIAAFQRLLGERVTEREPGEFTISELAEAFRISEETVRTRMRSAVSHGEATERRAVVGGSKVKVYRLTPAA